MQVWLQNTGRLFVFAAALISICICTIKFALSEEPLFWDNLKLYGGQINTIAFHPQNPNILFAGSWLGGGLFRSIDGGQIWQAVEGFRNKVIFSIAIDPDNPNTIWVICQYAVYKSKDGGTVWSRYEPAKEVPPGITRDYYAIAIDQTNPLTVYVGASGMNGSDMGGTVYKTIDGGTSWMKTQLVADQVVYDLTVNPKRPDEIWAVTWESSYTRGGAYKTNDAGRTWQRVFTGLPAGWFDEVAIHPQDPDLIFLAGANGVYRTEDNGRTWQIIPGKAWCFALTIDPLFPDTIYASWIDEETRDFEFGISIDRGSTWKTQKTEDLYFLSLSIAMLNNSRVLYGGEINFGIYRSIDGGETWTPANQGIEANPAFSIARSPFEPSKIMVGSMAGVYIQNQKGEFKKINSSVGDAVAFDPLLDGVLYFGTAEWLGISIDDGESWDYIPFDKNTNINTIVADENNDGTVFVGTGAWGGQSGAIYKTTNRGTTWQQTLKSPTPVNIISINPKDTSVMFAGTGHFFNPPNPGNVLRSFDGGENWSKTGLQDMIVNALAIDPRQSETVYAGVADYGIFKSENAGRTWTSQQAGLPSENSIMDLAIDVQNPATIYLGTYEQGVFFSSNRGAYWTCLGLSDYNIFAINLHSSVQGNVQKPKASSQYLLPPHKTIAGTRSGLYEYNGAGSSVLVGKVINANNQAGVANASLSCDNGQYAITGEDGYYMLLLQAGITTLRVTKEGYKEYRETVSVAAAESKEYNFTLDPDLAEVPPENGCPVEIILKDAGALSMLRMFRDTVLMNNAVGQKLVALYYRHAADIKNLLVSHEGLLIRTRALLLRLLPVIKKTLKSRALSHLPVCCEEECQSPIDDFVTYQPLS